LDGDTLTFNLYYSPDGSTWLPLGTDVNDTQLTIDAGELPGSPHALVRVIATDGIQTTTDESDGPIAVGSKPPQATVLSPEAGGPMILGAPLLLEGSAFDPEDGTLGDASLAWASDLDGALGTGQALIVELSEGSHTITLTATDSDSSTNTDSLTVDVIGCYGLSLSHTGEGADPVPAPDHSSICPEGEYTAGEEISLSASPAAGWTVSAWAGTHNDLSRATTNTVIMPANDYGVMVSASLLQTLVTRSTASYDGWILESTETSNSGGSMNATSTTLRMGDEAGDRQYRSILSFNTAGLPDNAVITKVTLKIRRQSIAGTNPFSTHGNLLVDVRTGKFYGSAALQLADFKSTANLSTAGSIPRTIVNGWYTKTWTSRILDYINKNGLTQLRLRFTEDDNEDLGADYLNFYSGNAASSYRPQLIIDYYVP
jgi:hypothetical protein